MRAGNQAGVPGRVLRVRVRVLEDEDWKGEEAVIIIT